MKKLQGYALIALVLLFDSSTQIAKSSCVYNTKARSYICSTPINTHKDDAAVVRYHSIDNSKRTDVREEFIEKIAPIAEDIQSQYNIPASVLIAMACLESNYGQSELSTHAHNYFGIKADSTWTESKYECKTCDLGLEHYQSFRKYSDLSASCRDYALFLSTKDRYRNAFEYKTNPTRFCQTILRDGYCPTSSYLDNVQMICDRYSLTKYNAM